MSGLTAYYRSSVEYREMLAAQDEGAFALYLSLFARWARPGSRVLDVGCGVGKSTMLLRARGFDAVGADPAGASLPTEDGFFAADFTGRTEVPDDAFAAVGALNVLEHVERPRDFLAELVRVVGPGGVIVLTSPNLTSPLVGARILFDLAHGRSPYLGIRRARTALALLARNVARSTRAALGRDDFAPRRHTLSSGIVGADVDAIYWTNAAEVRRHLERLGCSVLEYQTEGRTPAARALARALPSFAGLLVVVVRVGTPGSSS